MKKLYSWLVFVVIGFWSIYITVKLFDILIVLPKNIIEYMLIIMFLCSVFIIYKAGLKRD